MKSNRLPGKVLKKIDNETILEKIFNSLKKCKNINETIIATSKDNSDNKIVNFCKKKKFNIIEVIYKTWHLDFMKY